MNVWKSTPAGKPRPASRDSPVPRINRKSTGCSSEVTARSRSVRNLISARRQTMLTARRSARMLRSGTATLMSSVRSRSSASTASRLVVSCAAIATSLPPAEPGRDPAVAVADRSLGVADRLAGIGHEYVVEGGPGHAHRLDRHRQAREQLGHEVLARLPRARHQSLAQPRVDPEYLGQRPDGGGIVRGADLDTVLADRGLERLRGVDRHDFPVVD